MEKDELRALGLKKREALTEEERITKSSEIATMLESLPLFQQAKNILFYYSHNKEVKTIELMKKYMKEKNLFLPRLTSENSFIALPFSAANELKPNGFGIPEPPLNSTSESTLDLIIVPGVAFDRDGNRIGMGKGFYDRFLAGQKDIPRVGLAYSEQILDRLPKEPYDEIVNMILTEKEVIQCPISS